MPKYLVHVSVDWIYEAEADSPEDAAAEITEEMPNDGECTGYSIESVTHSGEWYGDDLRAPLPCRGGCGKSIPAARNDECSQCLIARLDKRSLERAAS